MENEGKKTEQQGYETAIRLLQEEIRRHYGCKDEPCKDDHGFDAYGDALAQSIIAIRRLARDHGTGVQVLEVYQ